MNSVTLWGRTDRAYAMGVSECVYVPVMTGVCVHMTCVCVCVCVCVHARMGAPYHNLNHILLHSSCQYLTS